MLLLRSVCFSRGVCASLEGYVLLWKVVCFSTGVYASLEGVCTSNLSCSLQNLFLIKSLVI